MEFLSTTVNIHAISTWCARYWTTHEVSAYAVTAQNGKSALLLELVHNAVLHWDACSRESKPWVDSRLCSCLYPSPSGFSEGTDETGDRNT